jgi:hypothetical protein
MPFDGKAHPVKVASMSRLAFALLAFAALPACSKHAETIHTHVDQPPHGGTPVSIGDEHLEFVRDSGAGRLDAYVLDDEMEEFVRIAMPSFEVVATVGGEKRPLVFAAVPNPATGETVGDTSCFSAQADWLRTTPQFDAVLTRLELKGETYTNVTFNFPKGNDAD